MKRSWFLVGLFWLASCGYSLAQTSFTFKDATGATQTASSFNCSSKVCQLAVLAGADGVEKGTSGNPVSVTLNSTSSAVTVVQLGEVQASPTANTVLDRLKTINTTLGAAPLQEAGSVTANLGTLNGAATSAKQDTINTSLGTINTTLGTPMKSTGGTVTITPAAAGGWTPILASALSTTVGTVAASASTLGYYFCWNPNATVTYIQIFDISGGVTLGTSTPKLSIGIPPTSAGNLEWANGVHFANAIKVAATTTATGLTAPSVAVDCNFGFK